MLFLGPFGGTLLVFIIFIIRPDWWTFFFGAMVVYLWLPLLALAAGAAKTLNYFRLAVGWAQWFLKQGQNHPLEAIGYVAAIIVFTATVVSRLLFTMINVAG